MGYIDTILRLVSTTTNPAIKGTEWCWDWILEDWRISANPKRCGSKRGTLSPNIRRTFAPRGQTPIIKKSDPHGRISAIGALTISPKQKRPNFYYELLANNANFRSDSVIRFIDKVQRRISGPITILWDAIPIHCSKPINQFLENHNQLNVEQFPSYAPELNPVDKVWLYLKFDRLPNYVPVTVDELRGRLVDELNTLRNERHVLASCVRRSGLGCPVQGWKWMRYE
jgi:transposase